MTDQEKREKVVKGLECCIAYDYKCNNCPYQDDGGAEDGCYSDELKTDALALLKAQEPVKPRTMEFIDEGLTWEKYEVPTCGVCGALLGGALFCPMCGRAVKWE